MRRHARQSVPRGREKGHSRLPPSRVASSFYCTSVDVCPASVTEMVPAQAQVHCDASSRAGTPPVETWAAPGVHGVRTGWQGWGVRVPPAALVAAATCGLAGDWHSPNGGTLPGAASVMTPAGVVADTWAPEAAKVDGVAPIEHCSVAPVTTWLPMRYSRGRVRQESFCGHTQGGQDTLDRAGATGFADYDAIGGTRDTSTHCDIVCVGLFPPQAHDDDTFVGNGILKHMLSF